MSERILFPFKVWNTLNMSRGCIAAEVKAENPEKNRKWVSIYPLKKGDVRGLYRYFEVELTKEIIEKDLDWFQDEEITTEVFGHSLDDLYQLLESKKLSPSIFDVPWKSNFPHHY